MFGSLSLFHFFFFCLRHIHLFTFFFLCPSLNVWCFFSLHVYLSFSFGQNSKQTERKLTKARDKRDITQNNICECVCVHYMHMAISEIISTVYEGVSEEEEKTTTTQKVRSILAMEIK